MSEENLDGQGEARSTEKDAPSPDTPSPGDSPDVDELLAHSELFLTSADQILEREEERRSAEQEKRRIALENRFVAVRELLSEVEIRLERARRAEIGDLAAKLEKYTGQLATEREKLIEQLGYDPDLRYEEERQREIERFNGASEQNRDRLLQSLDQAATRDDLQTVVDQVLQSLPELRLADARTIVQSIDTVIHEHHWEDAERVNSLLGEVMPYEADEKGEEAFRSEMQRQRERREEASAVDAKVGELVQESILLETQALNLTPEAVALRIQEICCRAKLLQQKWPDVLSRAQQEELFKSVFGRLRRLHGRLGCPYVEALRRDWMPPSLEVEIEDAHRQFLALSGDEAGDSEARLKQPSHDEMEALRQQGRALERRLDEADRWVIAAVYRRANRVVENPSDEAARENLRRTVSHALAFLEGPRRAGLPELLLDIEEVFEQGADFRWLRGRFRRLCEKAAADAAEDLEEHATDEDEEPDDEYEEPTQGRIEAMDGDQIVHPSVTKALALTRGRRLAILGGPADDSRCDSLAELLEAAHVEWIPHERGDGTRLCQTLARRIESGGVDLVVLLTGFLGHKNTIPVLRSCHSLGVPAVIVPRGRGDVGIATAIASLAKIQTEESQATPPG